MMKSLSFLKDITLVEKSVAAPAVSRTKKEYNPTEADIRLFRNGSVYPSLALITEFDLEYRKKSTPAAERGNGFDLVDTKNFLNYPANNPRLMLIAAINKSEPKVDLFSRTTYQADKETPAKQVAEQGAMTRGKELIEELIDIYGYASEEALFGEQDHIDLKIARSYGLRTPNGIAQICKKVAAGERKGEFDVQRRENLVFYPLIIKGSDWDEGSQEGGDASAVKEEPVAPAVAEQAPEPQAPEPSAWQGPGEPAAEEAQEPEQAPKELSAADKMIAAASRTTEQQQAHNAAQQQPPRNPLADLL